MYEYIRRDERGYPDRPSEFPHKFVLRDLRGDYAAVQREAAAWCRDQFGPVVKGRWNRTNVVIFFRDDNDAFAFRMRWC